MPPGLAFCLLVLGSIIVGGSVALWIMADRAPLLPPRGLADAERDLAEERRISAGLRRALERIEAERRAEGSGR